jgi:CRP-like cAMP-binding protein
VGSVYVAALMWSMQTATTVGYGDIQAQTDAERMYMVVAMLVGGSFFSFIIGAFVGVIASLSQHEAATAVVVDQVNEFIATAGLPLELATRLRAYFRHQHTALTELNSWHSLLDVMSPALRGDVAFAVNAAWLSEVSLFAAQPPSLLIELSLAFRPISFPPGEVLMSRGDDVTCASLMVITRGVVSCGALDNPSRLLLAGRHRTELLGVEALHPGCRVAATVASVGPVKAQALRMDALLQLAQAFPTFSAHLRRVALRQCLLCRMRDVLKAVRRVRRVAADATAAGDKLHIFSLAAAATGGGGSVSGRSDAGAAAEADLLPTAAALLAVSLAVPEEYARAAAAALTLQRMWRGSRARGTLHRKQRRQRASNSMVRVLEARGGSAQFRGARFSSGYDSEACASEARASSSYTYATCQPGGGGGLSNTRVLAMHHTLLQELAAVKALLHASATEARQHERGRGGACACCGAAAAPPSELQRAALAAAPVSSAAQEWPADGLPPARRWPPAAALPPELQAADDAALLLRGAALNAAGAAG